MEKMNTPDPIFERIRGSPAVHLPCREASLLILSHLNSALCNGKGEWSKADHRIVENHGTIEVSIKFEIHSDAL
jgi:hypothetical protein